MIETAISPRRWASGKGLMSSVTSVVRRGTSSLASEGPLLGIRLSRARADIFESLDGNEANYGLSATIPGPVAMQNADHAETMVSGQGRESIEVDIEHRYPVRQTRTPKEGKGERCSPLEEQAPSYLAHN